MRRIRNAVLAFFVLTGTSLAGPVTIAALGDSLTQGYGLPRADGFVPKMETWLNGHGADVKLINAGVSGDTTAGGLTRIDWTLSPNVQALIVTLGGNDILRGIDPAVSRANLDGILKVAKEHGVPVLLVGMKAPPNYGSDYQAAFDAIYPGLAKKYGTLYYPDFFNALNTLPFHLVVVRKDMQADGLHPNAKGVGLIVADMGPSVLQLVQEAE